MASIFEQQARDINSLKRQNKEMLQYASQQNQQMQHLNNQLAQATAIQEETLRKQLKQEQEAFEQKMYKDLLFLIENISEIINSINDPIFQYYFINLHYPIFRMHSEIAMETLTEIADKQAAKKIIAMLDATTKNFSLIKDKYDATILSKFDSTNDDYQKLLSRKPSEIPEPIKPVGADKFTQIIAKIGIPVGIFTIFIGFISCLVMQPHLELGLLFSVGGIIIIIMGFVKKSGLIKIAAQKVEFKKGLAIYNKNQSEITAFENETLNHPIHSIEAEINKKYPDFMKYKNRIDQTIQKFNDKWKAN